MQPTLSALAIISALSAPAMAATSTWQGQIVDTPVRIDADIPAAINASSRQLTKRTGIEEGSTYQYCTLDYRFPVQARVKAAQDQAATISVTVSLTADLKNGRCVESQPVDRQGLTDAYGTLEVPVSVAGATRKALIQWSAGATLVDQNRHAQLLGLMLGAYSDGTQDGYLEANSAEVTVPAGPAPTEPPAMYSLARTSSETPLDRAQVLAAVVLPQCPNASTPDAAADYAVAIEHYQIVYRNADLPAGTEVWVSSDFDSGDPLSSWTVIMDEPTPGVWQGPEFTQPEMVLLHQTNGPQDSGITYVNYEDQRDYSHRQLRFVFTIRTPDGKETVERGSSAPDSLFSLYLPAMCSESATPLKPLAPAVAGKGV